MLIEPAGVRALLAGVICASSLVGGPPAAISAEAPSVSAIEGSPVAEEVWSLIDKYFLDRTFNGIDWPAVHRQIEARSPMSEAEAVDEAERLVKRLGDRYSRVVGAAQAAKLNKYDVTGVGLNLIIAESGEMRVGAVPAPDTTAAAAGIRYGERVLRLNGQATAGMSSFDALEAIQGDGDRVEVEVQAPGAEARTLSLLKAYQVKNPLSKRLLTLDDGSRLGYLKLTEFNAQCNRRMRVALGELERDGAQKLVLDLRGNGGGVLDGALGIAGMLMERPLVLYVNDANGARQPLYSREKALSALPLQVWVDAKTASSGEVLAGALHDNCRAAVLGQRTYGKGVIQGVFGLSNGGALIETVASYATPSGEEINQKGVSPDEEKFFASDVLGASFIDADLKSATFERLACAAEVGRRARD